MLWTVMPLEMVMEGSDSFAPTYTEISWQESTLVVEPLEMNTARVVRIISTNPEDYLNPQVQPGSIIQIRNNQPDLS
ncbi:MAG TPA: YlzJ-like family protein [Oscillospiraceae bacterium]|nr:YlzJ-like family protein [Oscillospiraceae bacterium]